MIEWPESFADNYAEQEETTKLYIVSVLLNMRRVFDHRQLLGSTVITNNGKNSQNWLKALSRTCTRYLSTSQAVGDQTAHALDWMKNIRGKDNELFVGERGDWWWTGKAPTPENLTYLSSHRSHVSCLPQVTLKNVTQKSAQDYFDNSWLTTEVLFAGLQGEEAFYRPPYHHLRHPMIFYYGHPATFYTNKLRVAGLIEKGLDPYFEELFEVGVDEMRWDDISQKAKDWPEILEVHEYRKKCHELVTNVISEQFGKKNQNIDWTKPLWALMMGFEHEKIHLETSSVLMRELPQHLVKRPQGFPLDHPSAQQNASEKPAVSVNFPKNELINVKGSIITLGKTSDADNMTYGWDNEFGKRVVEVSDFNVSKFKVSNGEFYEFVSSGGYREKKFWSEDGWGWRTFRNQKWPSFWVQRGPAGSHLYALRTIFDEVDMPWNWPVCVNYHEAAAFCNWKSEKSGKSLRLITETEFQCTWDDDMKLPLQDISKNVTISDAATEKYNNHLLYGSERPVDAVAPNSKGIYDAFGNTWDWAEDCFNPLPGNEVHPFYDDFSAPCYDGAHKMIFGGSFISASDNGGNLYSRYHFRPHFQQHAGFRYVESSKDEVSVKAQGVATFLDPEKAHFSVPEIQPQQGHFSTLTSTDKSHVTGSNMSVEKNTYETEQLLDQYVALHFGQNASNVDDTVLSHPSRPDHALRFAQRSADLLTSVFRKNNPNKETIQLRALDVGCAVGGAAFQLAESFGEVHGFDFSVAFVNKANEIKNMNDEDVLKFEVPVQGNLRRQNIAAVVPSKAARQKTSFVPGDATKLNELGLGKFDAVLCANLICRLPEPMKFLDDLQSSVNQDGVVLFLSPYSWLDEFTNKDKWLQQGDKSSCEALKMEMKKRGFEPVHEENVPLIIREHERKYQYIVSHGLAFKKV